MMDNRGNLKVRKADRDSIEASKEDRTKRKDTGMDENEMFEENEDTLYGAGNAD